MPRPIVSIIARIPGMMTPEEMRALCAGITKNDTILVYDETNVDPQRVYDALPHPEGVDCRLFISADAPHTLGTQLLMTTIFVFLSIIGIVGNFLVITVVRKVKGMITPTNCYLTSLAISDSLFFIATTPTEIGYLYSSDYHFGSVGCAVFTFLPFFAINLSSLSITAFTLERYYGICAPYKARQMCTVERAKLILKFIWGFAILYNSPWLFLAKVENYNDGTKGCSFRLKRDNIAYQIVFAMDFLMFYVIPMALNIFIYIKIYFVLIACGDKLKSTEVNLIAGKTSNSEEGCPTSAPTPSDFNVSGGRSRASTRGGKNSVVKMLAVVVLVFATCWFPYRAMVFYNSFSHTIWDPDWFIFFSKTLIFINCAINPILYNLMSQRFRNAFKVLLSGNGKSRSFSPTMTAYSRTKTMTVVDREGRTTKAPLTPMSTKDELKSLVNDETP